MTNLAIAARLLDSAGVLVLDATEAAGYLAAPPWGVTGRTWRRSVVTADDVEGDVEQQSVLAASVYQLGFIVTGATGAQVETRISNLINAAEARSWRLEVTLDGVVRTWLANRADSTRSYDRSFLAARRVPVTLRVPIQPRALEE